MKKLFLPLFNICFFLFYIVTYDINDNILFYFYALSFVLALYGLTGIIFFRKGFIHDVTINLNLFLFSFIFIFFLIELSFQIIPVSKRNIIPLQLRNFITDNSLKKERNRVIEYLKENPYVKFRPNVLVRSQGWRGTDKQFVYEWRTDETGFKNLPGLPNWGNIDLVILGDSFTEGMGVSTEDTYPGQLNKKGLISYNLGVQGYAPTQFYGAFEKFGKNLKPKYVIIGYCATIYDREASFFNIEEAKKSKKFTGGIQSIVDQVERGRDIKAQSKYLLNAIYLLSKFSFYNLEYAYRHLKTNDNFTSKYFAKLGSEIQQITREEKKLNELNANKSKEWQSTINAFTNIAVSARKVNARTILLYLPLRRELYYEKAKGEKLPEKYIEKTERKLLQEFCLKNNIVFLDPTPEFLNHISELGAEYSNNYPYLEIDGHPSPLGYRIISNVVENYIRKDFDKKTIYK